MNPRFSLALVALLLIGGAVALWWNDRQPSATPHAEPIAVPSRDSSAATPVSGRAGAAAIPPQALVLAISWHPAFCETQPRKPECRNERGSDYGATHLTLHGLWPDDEYCGVGDGPYDLDVAGRWDELAEPDLTRATRASLDRVMPGTADNLHRHEWIKHGTCSYTDAENFYGAAIALVEAVNTSAVGDLFAQSLGNRLTRDDIRDAFDAAFGRGAGRKVRLNCEQDGSRGLVSELRINLYGSPTADLATLLRTANDASAGCSGGLIDRVGDQ